MNNEDESTKDKNSSAYSGGLVGLIILIAFCLWGYNSFIKTDYSHTWWDGDSVQRICGTGNLQSFGCNDARVYSVDGKISSISVQNTIATGYSECYKAADIYDFDRFCRFWEDGTNQKWDILPLGSTSNL